MKYPVTVAKGVYYPKVILLSNPAGHIGFLAVFAHKIAKKQNCQNLSTRFADLHISKVQSKFQVPSMYAVQMNVPFVLYK